MASLGWGRGGTATSPIHTLLRTALPAASLRAALPAAAAILLLAAPTSASRDFPTWLAGVKAEALERGISEDTVEHALDGIEPIPRVIELDRRQPRKPSDFCDYMKRRLTPTRIARGKRVLEEQSGLLQEINREYGVPARYVVALWGLETNYGDYMGDFPVVAALATLAHEGRREELFREQVFAALRIVEEGHHPAPPMQGSWAGATGLVQLMPTTFLKYAVDHDGDGRKDVWTNVADALATAASYLRTFGWRGGETWGRQASLPPELATDRQALKRNRSLAEWQRLGVRRVDGSDLPLADMRGKIVLPLRRVADPAFLVYRNYRSFLAWNDSTFFALSVGALADELAGASSLQICK